MTRLERVAELRARNVRDSRFALFLVKLAQAGGQGGPLKFRTLPKGGVIHWTIPYDAEGAELRIYNDGPAHAPLYYSINKAAVRGWDLLIDICQDNYSLVASD